MTALSVVGGIAAFCTTFAFVPQIVKIKQQGGEDLSYPMLFLYLTGTALWLVYGLMLHAPAVIWANALTTFLVIVALILKATHPLRYRRAASPPAQTQPEMTD
jgi:MtN3 and saliva related transmembrane protein